MFIVVLRWLFSKALSNNHEKLEIISMWCCEPLRPKGLRIWKKSFCENRVKTAVRSGKNRGISKFFIEKWPHSEEFSQCKNMEGWNFNVFQAGRKKFVIAAAASCDCSRRVVWLQPPRRVIAVQHGAVPGRVFAGGWRVRAMIVHILNNDCTYIELLNNLSC